MFRTADVFVDGQHFIDDFGVERSVLVLAVGITQIIPTRTDESVECVWVSSRLAAADGAGCVHKRFALGKRRLSVGAEFYVFGQFDG